jgi:calcineurin-like phosphoesterase family protein
MANVWFCSDLHLDHENIGKFRKHVSSPENNEELIFNAWESLVTKRDIVWVLGDACFSKASLYRLGKLKGEKRLIRGNHDDKVSTQDLLKVFTTVEGLVRYKGFWMSHAPIHPDELRGKRNVHGHVHYATVDDPRYFNACVENVNALMGRPLINLQELLTHLDKRKEHGEG